MNFAFRRISLLHPRLKRAFRVGGARLVGFARFVVPLGLFVLGFVLTAAVVDGTVYRFEGAFVPGLVFLAVVLLLALLVANRFRLPSNSARRMYRLKIMAVWTIPGLVQPFLFGVVTMNVGLLLQTPTETRAHLLLDDYDAACEPYRVVSLGLLQATVDDLKSRFSTVTLPEGIDDILDTLQVSGPNDALAARLMHVLWEQQALSHKSIVDRLSQLRHDIGERTGDEIVVFSGHRLPPSNRSLAAVWPMPPRILSRWITPAPNDALPDASVASFLSASVAWDAAVAPMLQVTYFDPSDSKRATLRVVLQSPEQLTTTTAPASAPSTDTVALEYAPDSLNARLGQYGTHVYSWQVDLPRRIAPTDITFELTSVDPNWDSTQNPTWRFPITLPPNSIAVIDTDQVLEGIRKRLGVESMGAFPMTSIAEDVIAPGRVTLKRVQLGSLPEAPASNDPVVEILEVSGPREATSHVVATSMFRISALRDAGFAEGTQREWPNLGETVGSQSEWRIYARTDASDGTPGAPIVFQRFPATRPNHITVVLPNDEVAASLTGATRAGIRHALLWAASLVARDNPSREPIITYLREDTKNHLPAHAGDIADPVAPLQRILRWITSGGGNTRLSRTPDNFRPAPFAGVAGLALIPTALLMLAWRKRREKYQ